MSYRTLYLVCYDICSPQRLRQVYRYLLAYKVGGQKSFFECWLTPPELREVQQTLNAMMDASEDCIHIFQLDPRMQSQCYGQAHTLAVNTPFMVL